MLPQLQAETQLAAIEAASVPNMTDSARRQVIDRYHRQASGATRTHRRLHDALSAMPIEVVEGNS